MAEGNYSDFVTCPNGHKYMKKLGQCPFCPKPGDSKSSGGVTVTYGQDGNINPSSPAQADKDFNGGTTQILGDKFGNSSNPPTAGYGAQAQPVNAGFDAGKTGIIDDIWSNDGSMKSGGRKTKKLVGVLYSTSIDAMGVLFNVYEGKNPIGRNGDNSIVIATDGTVSGNHAEILYRMGEFSIFDTRSTSGTFVNDEYIGSRDTMLNDGDVIKVGVTTLLFRSFSGVFNHNPVYNHEPQPQMNQNQPRGNENPTQYNDDKTRTY